MAKLLIWDRRVEGEIPWVKMSATCVVDERHSMSSIVTWVAGKTANFTGKETLVVAAHGYPGWLLLGKDMLSEQNVHLWAKLRGKLAHILLVACSVANTTETHWDEKKSQWAPAGNGLVLCSSLAGYTKAFVSASDAPQTYFKGIPLLADANFGAWEGNVYTWGPNGKVYSVGWE